MNIKALLLFAAMSVPVFAMASEAFDTRAVEAKQERIRRAMDSGSAGFSEASTEQKKELMDRQGELLSLIKGRTYGELNDADREKAQEQITWIDRTTASIADERMVCERTKASGTNRVTRVCMTARRKREALEAAQKSMTGPQFSPQYDRPVR